MRLVASALLALGLVASACAQPVSETQGDPALWRIADADSEIWLFGTVHLLPDNVAWRNDRVDAAFAAADEFVTETDTGPEATAEFQLLATALGTLPEGQSLLDKLDAETRARFERVARAANLDPAQFTTVKPWLATLQLSYAHAIARAQRPERGVENVLEADAQGKRRSFLETPEQQVRTLADLSEADQIRFLAATLRQIEQESDALLGELDRAWARGELTDLAQQLDAQVGEAGPAVHRALITDRNRAWADQIAQRLEGSGKIFIAVGAAHLVGDESVVALLRARGIEVEGP